MKGDDFLSCCDKKSKGCGGCSGHCSEEALNAITELEIYYSEPEGLEPTYIFDSLYCITNTQASQLRLTGLEGNGYKSLDMMKNQVIESLTEANALVCESYENADVVYIRNN